MEPGLHSARLPADSGRAASRLASRGASGQSTSSGCLCPGWANLSAGSAGCWGRNCGRPVKECLRGPAHECDGVVPRQAGDVDEPDDRLDADGGADAEHQLAEPPAGQAPADPVEPPGDLPDPASVA